VPAEHAPYLAHLRRHSDPDRAFADAGVVRDLIDSSGWQIVHELLSRVHEDAVTRTLFTHAGSEGRVLEQAEYARLLGFLAGLRQARWAAEAIVLHAERVRAKEIVHE
jgi:dihydropteroate synthase